MAADQPGYNLIVCADDYGLAPGVGQAIRHLLALGRISATGVMTVSPWWPEQGTMIREFSQQAAIGLHLTLTDHKPVGPLPTLAPTDRLPSLKDLLILSLTSRLNRTELYEEIQRQIDRFEAVVGQTPAFLDSHHHVHQLPIIREAVLDTFQRRLLSSAAWLRYCAEPVSRIRRHATAPFRALILSHLGQVLRRKGHRLAIPGNDSFRGVRNFQEKQPYTELFQKYLQAPQDNMLIMCHPGRVDDHLAEVDWVTTSREDEYRHLISDSYPEQLSAAGVRLVSPAGIHFLKQGRAKCHIPMSSA